MSTDSRGIPCLHIGLDADYAEAIWNDGYRVPAGSDEDPCDHPLARNIVLLAVAVAAEVLVRFAALEERRSYTMTLKDSAVRPYEVG